MSNLEIGVGVALVVVCTLFLRELSIAERTVARRRAHRLAQSTTYGSARDAAGFAMAWDDREEMAA